MIKKISALETYAVRHPVLRAGKPLESCHFLGDENSETTHFGLFQNEKLCAVASVFDAKSKLVNHEKQIQLRGMAVLESHQGLGLGAKLLQHIITEYHTKKGYSFWFNARIIAVPFYEKQDFQVISEGFEIEGIGTHFVMGKDF
uniref:GNAT family N-acetyltransferase n=1 Tax=Flavobacterium sp. TaxID=239 RepID=UPI00404AD15F